MNEFAIDIQDMTKVYRLYKKPHYRFLDAFGLLRFHKNAYTENKVLDIGRLSIRPGEKVAIIGRNGAGKSTLLKLIGGVISPTSGQVNVRGEVHALLQIGTGFHPDLTGRENVLSYLAHMRIPYTEIQATLNEIVDFSELEEYIDQPLKTYSTGMGVRLMFATSTAIAPDILIVDEVLSVGDSYFANKSFERIHDLCTGKNTTLLLVTHDVYSASKICDRMIWIDRGKPILDDDCKTVIKAYEASIRLQEEHRLRQRKLQDKSNISENSGEKLFFQIVPKGRTDIREVLTVSAIQLKQKNNVLNEINMRSGLSTLGQKWGSLLLDEGDGNWGNAIKQNHAWQRNIESFGSIHQRAPFIFTLPVQVKKCDNLSLELDMAGGVKQEYYLEVYAQDGATLYCLLKLQDDSGQQRLNIPLEFDSKTNKVKKNAIVNVESHLHLQELNLRFGNKRLHIDRVLMEDGCGNEKHVFDILDNAEVGLIVTSREHHFDEAITVLVAFLRNGLPYTRMCKDEFHIEIEQGNFKRISCFISPLLLGPGEYTVNVGIFEAGYFAKAGNQFFATNPMVIDMWKHVLEFKVCDNGLEHYNIKYIQSADYRIDSFDASKSK